MITAAAAVQAQHPVPDSLSQELELATHDSTRAKILFKLSDYWSDKDSARSASYLDTYAKNPVNSWYDAIAQFYRGGALLGFDVAASQRAYQQAERMFMPFESREAYRYRARAWHNYGLGEQLQDREKEFARIILEKYLPLVRKAGDASLEASAYASLGVIMMNFSDYEKAEGYLQKAVAIQQKSGDTNYTISAGIYTILAKTQVFLKDSISAKQTLEQAAKYVHHAGDSSYLPDYYLAQSRYYQLIKDKVHAITYLDSGQLVAARLGMLYDMYTMDFERYRLYRDQGEYAEAKRVLIEMLNRNIRSGAKNRVQIYKGLANTDSALGNYQSAYKWLQLFIAVNDSVNYAKAGTDLAAMENRFRTAENENQLLQLRNSNQRKNFLLWITVAVLLGGTGFVFYYMKQRRKKNLHVLKSLRQQQLIDLSKAQLEGEENERNRIAGDLHDGLGGMLAGVKLNLQELIHKNGDDSRRPAALEKISKRVDLSVDELRRIARNMAPAALLKHGFANSIESLCRNLGSDRFRIETQLIDLNDDIPQQRKLDIFRLVQELLANAIRHSGATEILVQCSQSENRLYITVEDNGKGFLYDNATIEKGFGLTSIRRRVELAGGTMELDTAPGKGTVVNIEIDAA